MIEHGDAEENMGVDGYEVGELGQGNIMQVINQQGWGFIGPWFNPCFFWRLPKMVDLKNRFQYESSWSSTTMILRETPMT